MTKPDDLMVVYSTDSAPDAEVLRGALAGEGIKCHVGSQAQGGFAGLMSMEVQLLVRAADYDRARRFIESHERARQA